MKEVGSEFWKSDISICNNNLSYLKKFKDYKLLMSGRTAIDYVLNDINDELKIVYMPNYCCESMVQPFLDNGYKIQFYNVDIINNKYDINLEHKCSIFFGMSYFGYNQSFMDNYIKYFSEKGAIIIEDITHRFMCENNYCKYSDYLICSLRKWFPIISGGVAINVKSKFESDLTGYDINLKFVNDRDKAMTLKRKYIKGSNIDKNLFLDLYRSSNEQIKNYKNKNIDSLSLEILSHIDIKEIKNRRIENSKIIYHMLNNNKKIKLIYDLKAEDCPLFVPCILENRDEVRKKLTENNIYLPAHWPKINCVNNNIYNKELSLINDQRYNGEDIEQYIFSLIKILGE